MAITTVICGACGANVSPRLWHIHGNIFVYTRTQHICPICGVVMYETGGEVTPLLRYGVTGLIVTIAFMELLRGNPWPVPVALAAIFLAFPRFSGRLVGRLFRRA